MGGDGDSCKRANLIKYEIISDVTEACEGVISDYDVNKIRLHRID